MQKSPPPLVVRSPPPKVSSSPPPPVPSLTYYRDITVLTPQTIGGKQVGCM